jgi:hypothetical protein
MPGETESFVDFLVISTAQTCGFCSLVLRKIDENLLVSKRTKQTRSRLGIFIGEQINLNSLASSCCGIKKWIDHWSWNCHCKSWLLDFNDKVFKVNTWMRTSLSMGHPPQRHLVELQSFLLQFIFQFLICICSGSM